jgi:lipid A 3-O-deacylase
VSLPAENRRAVCPPSADPASILAAVLAVLVMGSAVAPALAADPGTAFAPHLSLQVENDALITNTDGQYTSGWRVNWVRPLNWPAIAGMDGPKRIATALGWQAPGLVLGMGQRLFTPDDTASHDRVADDRPYAGHSFIELGLHQRFADHIGVLTLEVGLVGPDTGAVEGQRATHRLLDEDHPNGWQHQLDNEITANLFYEHRWRRLLEGGYDGFGIDMIAGGSAGVGNRLTQIGALIQFRLGWHLPQDYGTVSIRPGSAAMMGTSAGTGNRWGGYGFLALDGRAVAWDIFLDGNTDGDSHKVAKESLTGGLAAGLRLTYRPVHLQFGWVIENNTYKEQAGRHRYGSFAVAYWY